MIAPDALNFGEPRFKANITSYFNIAAAQTRIPVDQLERIKKPDTSLTLSLPLKRNDGSYDMIKAYRCRQSNYYLPTRGGLRLSQHVDLEEVEALGLLNTIKSFTFYFVNISYCWKIYFRLYDPNYILHSQTYL